MGINLFVLGIMGYLYVDIYGDQGMFDNLLVVLNILLLIKLVLLLGDVFG